LFVFVFHYWGFELQSPHLEPLHQSFCVMGFFLR
jgi:hypothetical protein